MQLRKTAIGVPLLFALGAMLIASESGATTQMAIAGRAGQADSPSDASCFSFFFGRAINNNGCGTVTWDVLPTIQSNANYTWTVLPTVHAVGGQILNCDAFGFSDDAGTYSSSGWSSHFVPGSGLVSLSIQQQVYAPQYGTLQESCQLVNTWSFDSLNWY